MKKIAARILALAALVVVVGAAMPAPASVSASITMTITKEGANLYNAPSTYSTQLYSNIPVGTEVIFLSCENTGWPKVTVTGEISGITQTVTGYIQGTYLC